MDLTKNEIRISAQKIYDMFFQSNSILDNVSNALDVSFNLPLFGEYIHLHTSHPQPLIADLITDFARLRGTRIGRGALEANLYDFKSPIEAMQEAFDYHLAIEDEISKTIDLCISLNDKKWEDFFRAFQVDNVIKYTHQFAKFIDGLKDYDEDNIVASFNKDFKAYITLQ